MRTIAMILLKFNVDRCKYSEWVWRRQMESFVARPPIKYVRRLVAP